MRDDELQDKLTSKNVRKRALIVYTEYRIRFIKTFFVHTNNKSIESLLSVRIQLLVTMSENSLGFHSLINCKEKVKII